MRSSGKKIGTLIMMMSLAVACQRGDRNPAPETRPLNPNTPPAPAQPAAPKQEKNLVEEDNKRREKKKVELLRSNSGLSRESIVRPPKIDDVVVANLQVVRSGNTVSNAKMVISLILNSQVTALKFSLDKNLTSLGSYVPMRSLNGSVKVNAEARCLKDCDNVSVRVRRENNSEATFVFNVVGQGDLVAQLINVPDADKDPRVKRIYPMSRLTQLSYGLSNNIERVIKHSIKVRDSLKEVLGTEGNEFAVKESQDIVSGVVTESESTLTEILALTRSILNGLFVKKDSPAALAARVKKINEDLTAAAGKLEVLIKEQKITAETVEIAQMAVADAKKLMQEINSAQMQLPLMIQLAEQLGQQIAVIN